MAQTGRANFSSAFGMRQRKADRFGLLRDSCYESKNKPNLWKTWWLTDITIVDNTKSLSDNLGSSPIFIMSE